MLQIGGGELLFLILAALIILGPSRLPGYAAKLGQAVRQLRDMAEGAKSQIKDEMGPAFDDIDWRQLDPRQYDPRRIVRDALASPPSRPATASTATDTESAAAVSGSAWGAPGALTPVLHDPARPTPYDLEAT
ncbi:twin-arginine translocase TatA/TatE family subunit [Ornithinimicrobium sp. Y1694]|uniref:twin-arginine translocase TatA/TatE family subunit n=1 Tax=Ornithinimicrobium sp. Y1694 TaxID=3418590 RepID=UPI003CF7AD49